MSHYFLTCLRPVRSGMILFSTLFLLACGTVAHSTSYRVSMEPDDLKSSQYMQLKLEGSLGISGAKVNDLDVTELSDLAWDADEKLLYAISDRGYLYTIRLSINNNKLTKADIISATTLKGKNKKPVRGRDQDSEGMTIKNANNGRVGDAELIISFEGNSRLVRYNTRGDYLGELPLPKKLSNHRNFRHGNKMLESLTTHPKYGLITAAELPLKANPENQQTLYSQRGQEWHFPRHKAAESSVTALEVLPNGDILVLERAFSGIFSPLVVSLRQVMLNQCDKFSHCKTRDLAVFNSGEGWNIDNFEGLTHLGGNRYLMVSDDNKNPLQQTLLVMFEVTP